jgi:hypothetical protein
MSFPFQEDINIHFSCKNDITTYLGCRERCLSCDMMRSSFCVLLCGEVVNVRLRNISNSTEPLEKRYTGALRALRPHIFVLTLVWYHLQGIQLHMKRKFTECLTKRHRSTAEYFYVVTQSSVESEDAERGFWTLRGDFECWAGISNK